MSDARARQARLAQAIAAIRLPADLQGAAFELNLPAAWDALEATAQAALAQAYTDAGLPIPDERLLHLDVLDLLRDAEIGEGPEAAPEGTR